ncbi:MAG: hypothetical protein ACPGR8_17285, partial [Limisphaerales bacterium]
REKGGSWINVFDSCDPPWCRDGHHPREALHCIFGGRVERLAAVLGVVDRQSVTADGTIGLDWNFRQKVVDILILIRVEPEIDCLCGTSG